MTTLAAISLDDVWLAYPAHGSTASQIVLKEITFTVRVNQCVAIVGPSGIGKTSLLKLISGLLDPLNGNILLNGRLTPQQALSERYFAWMFQETNLLAWKTAIENVELPASILGDPNLRQNAQDMIQMVGLEKFKNYYPHQLSGGMRSRVALARALTYHPQVLFLDEPFGALDEVTRESLCEEIQDITARREVTTLLVTHSVPEAIMLADRVLVLSDRPATAKAIIDVPLPHPRDASIRDSKPFIDLTNQVRDILIGLSNAHAS